MCHTVYIKSEKANIDGPVYIVDTPSERPRSVFVRDLTLFLAWKLRCIYMLRRYGRIRLLTKQ